MFQSQGRLGSIRAGSTTALAEPHLANAVPLAETLKSSAFCGVVHAIRCRAFAFVAGSRSNADQCRGDAVRRGRPQFGVLPMLAESWCGENVARLPQRERTTLAPPSPLP